MAKKIIGIKKPLCEVIKDKHGTAFKIASEGISPSIEIWWDRSLKHQEHLFLRQDAEGTDAADVVTLTLSQLYAAIDALNRAVME